jgi:DNA (cytosine-5)-methyltransferase 1
MFLVAWHKEIADRVSFPEPSHWIELPPGYEGSRSVALKLLPEMDLWGNASRYSRPPESSDTLPHAISAEDAIGDLPAIFARGLLTSGELKRGARRFDQPVVYSEPQHISGYASAMRRWPGFEGGRAIHDHVIRFLPRDYALFARLKAGDQYPEAYACALKMFDEKLATLQKEGCAPKPGSAEWKRVRDSIVPPYDPSKFPNKWRKMERDKPARTLLAHLGKDSYSHIHYDSAQARTISVREAARLQSFPDGFVFSGTMNPAFRQIGNAVPPLLARAVGITMANQLLVATSRESNRKVAAGAGQ